MSITIMESIGNGLTLFAPPKTIESLEWEGITNEFKEAFLSDWKWAYEQEQGVSFNGGIDTLSVLESIVGLIKEDKLDKTLSYEETFRFAARFE